MMDIRIYTRVLVAMLTVLPFIVTGCGKQEEFLVKIDKDTITVNEFNSRVAKLPERYQDVIKANTKTFLDEVIVDELLYREALRLRYQKDKEVQDVINEAKKKIIIAKLLKEKVDDVAIVEEDMAREYYEANRDEFVTPEILRASHILLKTEEDAAGILANLKGGAKFEDLAREKSLDPSAGKGGDIGYFVKGQLDPDFEKECFSMEEGQISGIIKTRFGYHVVKLTERKPPSIEKYSDVKERIRQNLIVKKKKQYFNDLVTRLRNSAKIVINEDALVLKAANSGDGNE